MTTFLTADPHFGHANVIRHDRRPFATIEEHDDALTTAWNAVVGQRDTVYILGDFAWKRHGHYLQALHGKKILVIGTHDKMSHAELRNFTAVVGAKHQPGIAEVMLCGHWFILSHYPLVSWNGKTHGSLHCHGHCHGRIAEAPGVRRCDVGVSVWDWAPIHVEALVAKLATKEIDHSRDRTPDELRRDVEALNLTNRFWRTTYDGSNVAVPTPAPLGGIE